MNPTSRFTDLSRTTALAVLAATGLAIGWCVWVAATEETLPLQTADVTTATADAKRQTDWVFYRRIVERVHAGEAYYDAVQDEFSKPEWGFQPTSVFHWRTPTYAWLLGSLPTTNTGKFLLALLALATSLPAFAVVERQLGKPFVPLVVLLIGPFGWCVNADVFLFTELWAGTLITLSVLALALADSGARHAWPMAVAAGIAAVFLRELALPYCLLALSVALARRRWRQGAAWSVGLALFALFYAWHAAEVTRRIAGSGDVLQAGHWIRFGGTAFVLGATELNNLILINLPSWLTGLYLPLALLGLAGWRGWTGALALTTCVGYLSAFAVVGQPYNAYWGLLIAPLLTLGAVALPPALRDLGRAIREQEPRTR